MGLTVIGIFKTTSAAEQAVEQLIRFGMPRNTIELSHQLGTTLMDDELVPDPSTNESGLPDEALLDETATGGGSLRSFLSSLFGDDPDQTDTLAQVAATGSVVTVHAPTDSDARQAANILTDNGALNVTERIGTYNLASSITHAAEKANPGRTQIT
ncbi:hypothetical protein [Spirosoma migulaei]